uniref:Uncharacterized protein n=1 Tax=Ananas comosus var. bracteatus TaxID=296719 RepID=A0A6V7Q372_ANACO|nr:unnamed protein product [Ananas comosus var. bracteatus]
MFRNKILIRASPSSSSNLFLLPLSLSLSAPLPPPTLSLDLETLCWKLSRQWRLACLLQRSHILLLYQRAQSDAVARVVAELAEALPSIEVGEEEEVKSESLIAKAVECGLRSIMLDQKWTCVGNNFFVESTFSCSEERRFNKVAPSGESIDKLMALWSFKHGLRLASDHFIAVQLAYGCGKNMQWLPSSFVLRGSGFAPATQTIRSTKAMNALESFMKVLDAWDFFSQDFLIVKELLSVGNAISNGTKLSTWEKATCNLAYCTGKSNNSNDSRVFTHTSVASKVSCLALGKFMKNSVIPSFMLLSSVLYCSSYLLLDFHTPRPALVNATCDKSVELTEIQGTNGPDQYRVPSFTRKKRTDVHKDVDSPNKLTHADSESPTCKFALEEDTSIKRGVNMQSVVSPRNLTLTDILSPYSNSREKYLLSLQSSENSQRKSDAFLSSNSSGNLAKVTQVGTSGKRNSSCKKKIRPFPLFRFASHFCKTIKLL